MLPRDLRIEHFRAYPPKAAKLAVDSLPALRRLPLSFLPSLLREVIEHDYKFPAERAALDKEVAKLGVSRILKLRTSSAALPRSHCLLNSKVQIGSVLPRNSCATVGTLMDNSSGRRFSRRGHEVC